jgi:cation diffusion facilitator family transporter
MQVYFRYGGPCRLFLGSARFAPAGPVSLESVPPGVSQLTCTLGGRAEDVEHRRQANRAIALSAFGLALTGGIEMWLALVTGSAALLGDALHNLSDVSTSAVVFLGFAVSRRPPTSRYPYGLERAEDLAGLGVALVVWASAAFAGFESYQRLVSNAPTHQVGIGIVGALLGIVRNQLVARYKGAVGRRIHSVILIADAKHSWLDALSSCGALVGLVAVALGFRWGDPLAGFAVTLFIVHVGVEVTREIVSHLLDGADPADIAVAAPAARSVAGVEVPRSGRGGWEGR